MVKPISLQCMSKEHLQSAFSDLNESYLPAESTLLLECLTTKIVCFNKCPTLHISVKKKKNMTSFLNALQCFSVGSTSGECL